MSLQKALTILQLLKISIEKYNTFFNYLSDDIIQIIINKCRYILDKIYDLPPNTEIRLHDLKNIKYNNRYGCIIKYLINKDRYKVNLYSSYDDEKYRIMNIKDKNIHKTLSYMKYITNNTYKFIPHETDLICLYCGWKFTYKDRYQNVCDNCTALCPDCSVDAIVEDKYDNSQYYDWHNEGWSAINKNPFSIYRQGGVVPIDHAVPLIHNSTFTIAHAVTLIHNSALPIAHAVPI